MSTIAYTMNTDYKMAISVYNPKGLGDLHDVAKGIFKEYGSLLPSDKGAHIFLKPNLNANMNALTGNTTDLRLLAAVIEELKEREYSKIKIGGGTNSGHYRQCISVISRLKVDALADYYGIRVIDLNYSEPRQVEFEDGVKASVAKDIVEADFLIN